MLKSDNLFDKSQLERKRESTILNFERNSEGSTNQYKKPITFLSLFFRWYEIDDLFYFNLNKNKNKGLVKRKVIFG